MATILIVDDERSIRVTMSAFLKAAGHDTECADDADAAMAIVRQQPVDIVLSDIVLPRSTGITLLRQIHEVAPQIQVIMMTGDPAVETAAEAVRLGAFDYLCKPVNRDAIVRVVESATRLKRANDRAEQLAESNRQYRENLERLVEERTRELREAQQAVVQQERLHALGQMASGIAHDFNNALTIIMGFTEVLMSTDSIAKDPAARQERLEMIQSAAADASVVVTRLREFYRQRSDEDSFAAIDLAALAAESVELSKPRWQEQARAGGATIDVVLDLSPVPPVAGVVGEIRQALINLIINATDAIEGDGTITVTTREDNGEVILEVTDTGHGMDDAHCQRCLEPFFTTKGEDGTGMGLAMVHGMAQRHQATLSVTSQVGRGTNFRVRWPAAGANSTHSVVSSAVDLARAEPQRVLVVDDEPRVAATVTQFLEQAGHTVAACASGAEALALLADRPFDLAILDRAMPGMNGDELALRIKAQSPMQPVIMLTGFGTKMKADDECPSGVDLVVAKPISRTDLQLALTAVLEPLAEPVPHPAH
jgi:signal transduction histidine kinase